MKVSANAPEFLTTERLVLRRPLFADAEDIHEYASDPQVTRFMAWRTHTDLQEAIQFIKTCSEWWNSGEEFCWVITTKPNGRAIGAVGCRPKGREVDFGYVLNREAWGNGFATEASRTVAAWAQRLSGIQRVYATCDAENHASIRVLEKTGLSLERVLRKHMIRPNISQEPRDTCVYVKLRS